MYSAQKIMTLRSRIQEVTTLRLGGIVKLSASKRQRTEGETTDKKRKMGGVKRDFEIRLILTFTIILHMVQ